MRTVKGAASAGKRLRHSPFPCIQRVGSRAHMTGALLFFLAVSGFGPSSFFFGSPHAGAPAWAGSLPADYDCGQEAGLQGIEDVYGPGNVTGISGNGSLTVGFGYAGELTLFRWPSPSYFDQVRYLTPFLTNACETRKLPRNGAGENMGSFAGIYLKGREGFGKVYWFRDEAWFHAQHYQSPESPVLVTESKNPEQGLLVNTLNFVVPGRDVLVRHYEMVFDPDTSIEEAKLFYYENMEIITEKIPYLPILDSALETTGDFGVLYHAGHDALIHFRPQDPRISLVPKPGTPQEDVDAWINNLDNLFPHDPERPEVPVFIVLGGDFSGLGGSRFSDGHQCGLQDKNRPPPRLKLGAFHDCLDGELVGNSAIAGNVDAALMKTMDPGAGNASFTVYLAAAGTAADAFLQLGRAREKGWQALMEETNNFWKRWIQKARMPRTSDPEILAVCKRTLVSIRQGWYAPTGAFVASVTTQPPYSVNWTRDGVYFAHVMDVAGFPEIAEKNLRFYTQVQRNCKDPESPCYDMFCEMEEFFQRLFGWHLDGTYDMSYYADGTPGAPIFYEIDNAGFASWGIWEHASFLGPEEKRCYLCGDPSVSGDSGVYPALKKTGDALALCITPGDTSGLQCSAIEDDTIIPEQSLNGAMAVNLALDAAIGAGEICGESPEKLESWINRKQDLMEAVEAHFWVSEKGHYDGVGPGSYLLWPARYPVEEEKFESHARYLFSEIKKHLNKETRVTVYIAKAVLALAHHGWDTGDPDFNLGWAIDVFLKDVPTPTRHYGEAFLTTDIDGDGQLEFSNRVAIPHLWEASLAYLSAMAYFGASEPDGKTQTEDNGSCGCSQVGGSGSRGLYGFVHLNLLVLLVPFGWFLFRRLQR